VFIVCVLLPADKHKSCNSAHKERLSCPGKRDLNEKIATIKKILTFCGNMTEKESRKHE
jgi:hypothetical protein